MYYRERLHRGDIDVNGVMIRYKVKLVVNKEE